MALIVDDVTYREQASDDGRSALAGVIVGLAVGVGLTVLLQPANARRLLKAYRGDRRAAEIAPPAEAEVQKHPISRAYVRQAIGLTGQGVVDMAGEVTKGVRDRVRRVLGAVRRHYQTAAEAGREAAREAQASAWNRYREETKQRRERP